MEILALIFVTMIHVVVVVAAVVVVVMKIYVASQVIQLPNILLHLHQF
jgi:hypothetical protein